MTQIKFLHSVAFHLGSSLFAKVQVYEFAVYKRVYRLLFNWKKSSSFFSSPEPKAHG